MNNGKKRSILQTQVAALPIRISVTGQPEVLLITSRDTGRWIIPKGWPMKARKDHQAAAREALEEAGVSGRIGKKPLGAYRYDKQLPGRSEACRVMVYLLEVREERDAWRESGQRQRRWFTPAEAAANVSEPRLAVLIRRLGGGEAAEGPSSRAIAAEVAVLDDPTDGGARLRALPPQTLSAATPARRPEVGGPTKGG